MSARECAAFITDNLELVPARGVPEILLWQATPASRLRRLAEAGGGRSPYWAYGWAGGAALARHVLDHPETVAGRSVLDLGCGGGLVAIAAAVAGAREVTGVDIDATAVAATALNAAANGVVVATRLADLLDAPPPNVEIMLVGDLFYEPRLAKRVGACLARSRVAGVDVLIGDPYRADLPLARLHRLAESDVPDFGPGGPRRSGVFELQRQAAR